MLALGKGTLRNGLTRSAQSRGSSIAFGAKETAQEFLKDLKAGVSEPGRTEMDPEWVAAELADFEEFGKRGEYYVLGQVALVLCVVFPPADLSVLMQLGGLALTASGLLIMVASSKVLGRNLSPLPPPRTDGDLVTDGMYQYMRHPIYTGLIATTLGLSAASQDPTRLLFAIGLIALLSGKAEFEEQKLLDTYGEKYRKYSDRVKRFGIV